MSEVKIPEGYKQTEVGIVPEDWNLLPAKEMTSFIGGYSFSSNSAQDNGIRWVKIANVGVNKVKWDAKSYLPYSFVEIHSKYLLKENDVVIALTRPILSENLKIARLSLSDTPSLLNQRVAKLEVTSQGDTSFAYYVLQTSSFIAAMNLAMAGTDPPNIGTKALSEIQVLLPLKAEQTAIATALSDVDNLIQSLEKLIAKKEAIKTGTMQQLLTGKTRLPEFTTREDGSKKGFKQTELGKIPEDWELIKLDNYFDFKNGLNKAKEFFGYGTPIVNYMDVYKLGSIDSTNIKGKVLVTTDEQINYSAKKGDVFFTRTSETVEEIGLSSVLESDIDKAVFSGFVLRARQKKEVLKPSFMKYCFRTSSSRKQIQGTASYTTRALTNGKLLSQILVPTPTKPEQTAIATILSDIDAEIQALQQRLEKTKDIKQGMMQQLLTGKVRLAH